MRCAECFELRRVASFPRPLSLTLAVLLLVAAAAPVLAQDDDHEPGILEPVSTTLNTRGGLTNPVVRIPNTDQSVDGREQSTIHGEVVYQNALATTSLLGHQITRISSPNEDMRLALQTMATAAKNGNEATMQAAAQDLQDILLGTTRGRIYDGFSMLNFNRWKDSRIGAEHFPPNTVPGEYKMKEVRDTGETFISPFDGATRKIWEVDISMLYYDGQIDSDTFLVKFPIGVHEDDTLRVNYRIYSLVQEDFSPTLVMLDRRQALNTVQFPFKGMDSVWVAFERGQITNLSVDYPPARMLRGVYTWGWREHPPRIQFMQPVYEIRNAWTGEIELDPQGRSYAFRNRENLTLENIGAAAPEKKMYTVIQAILAGAAPETIEAYLTNPAAGPAGTWIEWADLTRHQTQVPPEAWDLLAQEGIQRGEYGDYQMISVYMNNEMYGDGPFLNEIRTWNQGEKFRVKLINLDNHTHYFRNVDFGPRLHDDILRCCGGGETSFEIMNFKPSYGAPKVAEMQWRAGWGFRPHYDVIQQHGVFPRGRDRAGLTPYKGGEGGLFWGYRYSEETRGGDFRFNPPTFVIGFDFANPSSNQLQGADGENGFIIGQFTEGYGVAQMCPQDEAGFCSADISRYNPNGVLNWPPPPAREEGEVATELRFPPFLRNPSQGVSGAGDIIPPTGAWRPFIWVNPNNGSLYIDPNDPSKGFWADLTYGHGAPVYAGQDLRATVELPRASGQVFYQFDDLFHDNSIFSPHPVATGRNLDAEIDGVGTLNVLERRSRRIRGVLDSLSDGQIAKWVTLYDGGAGPDGCEGEPVLSAPTRATDGFFVFRCGSRSCSSPFLSGVRASSAPGQTICVQSSIGGFAEFSAN